MYRSTHYRRWVPAKAGIHRFLLWLFLLILALLLLLPRKAGGLGGVDPVFDNSAANNAP